MNQEHRKSIIAGNWKMYKTISEGLDFLNEFIPLVLDSQEDVYLAVPFTLIKPVADLIKTKNSPIVIGAQNMNDASEGAFTGEIAGKMLKDAGAKFVILGHSERRHLFHESNELINKKVKRALLEGLQVILCIGETKEEREGNNTEEILKTQLKDSLKEVSSEQLSQVILAYEPVWAIGTDLPATPEIAENTHRYCRELVSQVWGEQVGNQIIIQYGGSVKPENAKQFMEQPDIDGLLVGGASLSPETFAKIVNYQK